MRKVHGMAGGKRAIGLLEFLMNRRLWIRWEKSLLAFQGVLHLACALILMNTVLG